MTFEKAFSLLIDTEKGYSDNPDDPGNWTSGKCGLGILRGTKYGVAANTYPAIDIKSLTLGQAQAIYRRDYWDKLHLDEIPEIVRFDLFDAAVNSGISRAIKFLQEAVGVEDDGIIGPATISAANDMDDERLDKRLSGVRLLFLTNLPKWEDFHKGWARRIANNLIND